MSFLSQADFFLVTLHTPAGGPRFHGTARPLPVYWSCERQWRAVHWRKTSR